MDGIGTIYRKDLLDTLRDRRTLIFMLLVPTLATPVLIGGLSKLMTRMQQKQAVETVKIAADEADQLGDTSTLADPSVVKELVDHRMNVGK